MTSRVKRTAKTIIPLRAELTGNVKRWLITSTRKGCGGGGR